ncbi:MAG: nuclear transport factor 2 family protein [Alphaproteobacteria bacterium]|jgi:limonene-1,2-epoxide hydrolase|nr:limonene-1,2-epoxide hydrolase [Rhodobiaceae bacterium]MBO6544030.1 nuclear transport factor 2 family protein [Alphaproteobacteria bacterium]MBO6629190.1 nuclear transport factor 2 family protein [Alphaproteobacteria bacterium]MDF1627878.1 limonene-1,2-epoxide hydrolase family protein [Parvibaculaceae bacterium]|tara:strand:+ start:284 stop:652 length:369 start_codon:yes stop_codon:yes gene_type:complete
MNDPEKTIRDFVEAWSRLDAAELASYFCDDGVYHNIPTGPVSGRKNIEAFIAGFIRDWTSTEWDIVNLLAAGNLVIVERLDRTVIGDRKVDLPCTGIFEMEAGQIKVWRDYFDLGTYMKALA